MGFYLEKKRLDTLVGALCCVVRGFGWARWAGLGVGFGRAGRAGLGWAWIWLSVYIVHVFFMYISDVYHFERRKKSQKARLLRLLFDFIDLLALFGVYAGSIFKYLNYFRIIPLSDDFLHVSDSRTGNYSGKGGRSAWVCSERILAVQYGSRGVKGRYIIWYPAS